MPRDSIQPSPVPAGTPFTVNDGYKPYLAPADIFGDLPHGVGGGDLMTLHQGIPYVAWCEIGESTGYVSGPYVAKWNGSDWELVVSTPPFSDNDVAAAPSGWPGWDEIPFDELDLKTFVVNRSRPRLVSDGTDLYVGILGEIVQHVVLETTGGLFGPGRRDVFYPQWNPWLFRLAGDTLVPADAFDGRLTLFGESASAPRQNGYATENVSWGITAEEGVPGCQFVFSDAGSQENPPAAGYYYYTHFCLIDSTGDVTDIDVQELLTDDYLYHGVQGFDGAGDGSNLVVYYQDQDHLVDGVYGGDQTDSISIWTLAGGLGGGLIDSSDVSAGLRLSLLPAVQLDHAATIAGVRYLVFSMLDDPETSYDILKRVTDLSLPGAISDFVPGQPQYSQTTLINGAVTGVFVESANYWLSGHQGQIDIPEYAGMTALIQFDRQCATRDGWAIWELAAADVAFAAGSAVLYEDAFWYFQANVPGTSLQVAQVYKQPICRGCIPCPVNGLHVWEVV